MNLFNSQNDERRLSLNGRNAYILLHEDNLQVPKNISDPNNNKNYLTAKPNVRARSCSPLISTEKNSVCKENKNNLSANSIVPPLSSVHCFPNKQTNTIQTSTHTSLNSVKITNTNTPPKNMLTMMPVSSLNITPNNSGAIPKITSPKALVQTGLDRYVKIIKRKRSPKSAQIAPSPKLSRDESIVRESQNRFALLQNENPEVTETVKPSRPPPIYVREQNSDKFMKSLVQLLGENTFYVIPIKRGAIVETKIQVQCESNFRKLVSFLETEKKNFYTYQLKSGKGLQIVIKGIDSYVDPLEVKSALEFNGFKVKSVVNIRNRNKLPQPLFRVELEPGDIKLKRNETHPIYKLEFLLYRRVTVEEPHKRRGPAQCTNCQEYGHTRSYCKLHPVCVVCGELHKTIDCKKPRTDESARKCSNCGEKHTANYRGCEVYSKLKYSIQNRNRTSPVQSREVQEFSIPQYPQLNPNVPSYSNALRSQPPDRNIPQSAQPNPNVPHYQTQPPMQNFSRLEATIETLVQTITNFTNSMSNMMQEMMRNQSILLQAVLNKP